MARITLRQLLDHAAENDYGVPAFNIKQYGTGARHHGRRLSLNAPVIIQASRGARQYANDIMLKHMMDAVVEIYPQIPVCVHLDHGNGPAACFTAMQAGFTSVMMDGSLKEDAKTPADWTYNVNTTKYVADMAHLGGISVEGEFGVLGSLETGEGEKEDGHGFEGRLSHDQLLTNPDEAVKFVKATKVDALAIAMGTSHGAYKFTPQAGRRHSGDACHRRNPSQNAGPAYGHAWFVLSAAGLGKTLSTPMAANAARLGACRLKRIQRGIKKRRAKNQYRHRQSHGDHRPDQKGFRRKSRRIRSSQISEAGAGGG